MSDLNTIIATIGYILIAAWYLCMLWAVLNDPKLSYNRRALWFAALVLVPIGAAVYYANHYGGRLQFQKSLRNN